MPRFIDNNDGTVFDTKTCLLWQQSDDGVRRNWYEAKEYAKAITLAGHSNWRLPTIEELTGIIDYKLWNPACASLFTCRSNSYWSGSTFAAHPDYAWYVGFGNGYVGADAKGYANVYVRCVRAEKEPNKCQS